MSLIRSEHVNDQAVREAKDAVLAAETSLEEARSQLEKRERAQYHEEQIWSDTIRRNSTWVTFGLMGFNIFLLLASLVVFEPWRRRRMVREIKTALEAQKPNVEPTSTLRSITAVEAAIDEVVEPIGQLEEEVATIPAASADVESFTPKSSAIESEVAKPVASYDVANPVTEPAVPSTVAQVGAIAALDIPDEINADTTPLRKVMTRLKGMASEERILVRKKDFTATVLASTAAGWAIATIVYLVLGRSK
jgi:sensitive to high expression protein 9, mitochondrial